MCMASFFLKPSKLRPSFVQIIDWCMCFHLGHQLPSVIMCMYLKATITSFTNLQLVSHSPRAHDPLSWCIESLFLLVLGYIKWNVSRRSYKMLNLWRNNSFQAYQMKPFFCHGHKQSHVLWRHPHWSGLEHLEQVGLFFVWRHCVGM